MYRHVLLAVALQHWQEFSPYALDARDAAVGLEKCARARFSVPSVHEHEDLEASGLPSTELGRYREAQMQRIDAVMEQRMKAFLDGVPTDGLAVTPVLKLGDP